jgi:hypothetical protein
VTETNTMSPSINPRLNTEDISLINSDYLITSRLCSSIKKYKRRRLVLLYHPLEGKVVVRYLLALPGDWIKPNEGEGFFVNIPNGNCWVESLTGEDDSHTWGFVNI